MTQIRTDWTRDEIAGLFDLPFTELLFRAATVHREFHPPEQVQRCSRSRPAVVRKIAVIARNR